MADFNKTYNEMQAAHGKILSFEAEGKFTDAELCFDFRNWEITTKDVSFRIQAGELTIKKWIKDNGFQVCKKNEAVCALTVGDKVGGCFVMKQFKTYYLRNK